MDHLIPARRPGQVIINKKKGTCRIAEFAVLVDHRVKLKECEKKDKYLDLARGLKNVWKKKVTVIPVIPIIGALGTVTKGLAQGLEDLEIRADKWRPFKNSIIKIGQNTEESSGDLRGLTVTQTPVRNHRLTLVWKTRKGVNNDNNNNNNNNNYNNIESILENKINNIIWDFGIKTDHLVLAKRPTVVILKRKKMLFVVFWLNGMSKSSWQKSTCATIKIYVLEENIWKQNRENVLKGRFKNPVCE